MARKILRPHGAFTREDIEREAHHLSRLCPPKTHPCVVYVFDQGWKDHSRFYIDLQLCQESLRDRLRRQPFITGRGDFPTVQEMLEITKVGWDIASGLVHIHDLDVVHRDLKPENSVFLLLRSNIQFCGGQVMDLRRLGIGNLQTLGCRPKRPRNE